MLGQPLWQRELDDHLSALAWSPDGRHLVVGSLAGDGRVLDTASGEPTVKLADHSLGVLAADWSPDGQRLAVGGQDGVTRVVDGSGHEHGVLTERGWVTGLAWSPEGDLLAVATGRTLHLLDADAHIVRRYAPAPSTITAVVWSPDGKRVGIASYGGLTWYDPSADAEAPRRAFSWKGSLLSIAIAPDGKWVCAGSQDATVHLWRLWSGKDLSMSGYPAKIEHLAFRSDSRWMANACLGDLTIWDFSGKGPAGSAPAQANGHERHIAALTWQPGGTLLATGGADGRLVLWPSPRRQGERLSPAASADGAPISKIAWSPDGSRLAVGRGDGTIELREVA